MVNEPAPQPTKLSGWLLMAVGVLALVVGALWTLQGFDIVTDSRMSGVAIWSIIGPVVAIAGLISIILGVRTRTREKQRLTQDLVARNAAAQIAMAERLAGKNPPPNHPHS